MDGKSVEQSTLVDRISNLPNDVIDILLNHMSLRDAVRTSILSRNWRLHWTRGENLVLDYRFFYDALRDRRYEVETYKGIVGNFLLSHQEKFVNLFCTFLIMEIRHLLVPSVINLWILALSRYGVMELILDYEYSNKVFPSYIFSCMDLKHLSLKGVQLPHNNYGHLSSLLSLDLCCQTIDRAQISKIFLNCPLLERFFLDCKYSSSFAINASKLKLLHVTYHFSLIFVLQNTPNLSTVSFNSPGHPWVGKIDMNCQGMLKFFGAVPKIENITLTGDVLEEWAKEDVPQRLPAVLENHLSLTVCNFNIHSEAQIRSIFCLIESSPNLQNLDISMHNQHIRAHGTRDYLQSHIRKAQKAWQPQNCED